MPEPLSAARLDEIERLARRFLDPYEDNAVLDLIAELRRLRARVAGGHASPGTVPISEHGLRVARDEVSGQLYELERTLQARRAGRPVPLQDPVDLDDQHRDDLHAFLREADERLRTAAELRRKEST